MKTEERVPKLQVNKDGSRKKPIKHFDSHNYGIEVGNLTRQAEKLSKLIKMLRDVTGDKNVTSLGEFNEWLCEKSGFKSPSFSAQSMDLQDVYGQVHNLSKEITISKGDLTPMHKPSPQLLEDAKQKFTVYYTNEEYTDVLSLIQIQKQYSELSYSTRMTTGVNREGKLVSPLVNNFKLNNN